ncbi:MAG: hypothetical protein V1652_00915 [bacterium]
MNTNKQKQTKNKKVERFYTLVCVACGKTWDETETSSHCLSCGGPLDANYDYDYIRTYALNANLVPILA